jgi:hypothetical protein
MGGTEDRLTSLFMRMVQYASGHSFQGESMHDDLFGFCELNRKYSALERKLHAAGVPLADRWDVARNSIVTYITCKFNGRPANPAILEKALISIAEPYVFDLVRKYELRKAL